jgi:NAD-dependent SIR2 family protein deacetylase
LTRLVARREVVLLAGAGISLAAGYPSARAMTETVQAHLRRELNSPTLALTGMPFQEIASNIEAAFGRGYLLDIFLRAMSGPQGIEPTEAHLASVRLFDKILTTNFDALFEDACRRQNIPHAVVEDYEDLTDTPAGTLVFKLSGSLDRPRTLQITEQDVWNAYGDEPPIWEHLLETVTRSPVLIVGSSLRDTAVKKLCADALSAMRGYIVSPYINEFERLQYQRLGLSPITATADAFFRQLSLEAGAIPAGEPA